MAKNSHIPLFICIKINIGIQKIYSHLTEISRFLYMDMLFSK